MDTKPNLNVFFTAIQDRPHIKGIPWIGFFISIGTFAVSSFLLQYLIPFVFSLIVSIFSGFAVYCFFWLKENFWNTNANARFAKYIKNHITSHAPSNCRFRIVKEK